MKLRFSYVIPLAIGALVISVIGATFSVTGLAKLFAGAAIPVMVMAGTLEFSKVVVAGFVHRYWKELGFLLKFYLTSVVLILMVITSAGIFGYLSHAYQNSSVALTNLEIKIQGLEIEKTALGLERDRIEKMVNSIPENRVTKRLELQSQYEPQVQKLNSRISQIDSELTFANVEKSGMQAKIGPLVYVAEMFGVKSEVVAKWFILVFVCVFDPLAIVMVISVGWLLRREDEGISALNSADSSEVKLKKVS